MRRVAKLLCIGLAVLRPVFSDDADLGLTFLARGNFDEARAYLKRALQTDSTAASTRFLRARLMRDADSARSIYVSLAVNESVDRATRAEACLYIGDYYAMSQAHDSAGLWYGKSVELNYSEDALVGLAHATIAANQYDQAIAIAADSAAGPLSPRRMLLCGHACQAQGKSDSAAQWYGKAYVSGDETLKAAALAGRVAAIGDAGDHQQASLLADAFRQKYGETLESAAVESAAAGAAKGGYALQVGAFSSEANAQALGKKLQKEFRDVEVIRETVNGTLFHKVRVGTFERKSTAEKFGKKRLAPGGYTWRIVAKQ